MICLFTCIKIIVGSNAIREDPKNYSEDKINIRCLEENSRLFHPIHNDIYAKISPTRDKPRLTIHPWFTADPWHPTSEIVCVETRLY